jgi:glutamyl-tRNA reductase
MTPGLFVVGLNHTTAPVEIRERLAVADTDAAEVLIALVATAGLTEAQLVSTCNRVEVWGLATGGDGPAQVAGWFARRGATAVEDLAAHLYVREGLEAIGHMAAVAAGLDSMVVGEPQILGQVKAAHAAAVAHGTAGPGLAEAMSHALRIARRVRTDTGVGRGALSVGHAGVALARKIFGDLRPRSVVLVGAGEMGALVARHLADAGVSRLVITSRTFDHAESVARQTGGKAVPFEEFPGHAAAADILICAVTAPGVLVTRMQVETWFARRARPLFVIDLGVPRNVERVVDRVANVYLYDIDDLQSVVQTNRQARQREVERGRALVADAVARLGQAAAARRAAPTIRSLRAKVEALRQAEVERAVARLRDPSPEARAALETLSTALVNKILHGPIEQLKAAQAAPHGVSLRSLVRDLFGLGREDQDEPEAARQGEEQS